MSLNTNTKIRDGHRAAERNRYNPMGIIQTDDDQWDTLCELIQQSSKETTPPKHNIEYKKRMTQEIIKMMDETKEQTARAERMWQIA